MENSRRTRVIESILVLALALAVRIPLLDRPPIYDETFHLMAASSWAEDGTLEIADGEYPRAWLYTVLLAQTLRLPGPDLVIARGLSALFGSLWVLLLFLWLRAGPGRVPAWSASLLFCFAPGSLYLSQFIRFYSLHGLMFLAGALAFFQCLQADLRPGRRSVLCGVSFLFLVVAGHLQPTTLIGIAALLIWAVIAKLGVWRSWLRSPSRVLTLSLALAVLALLTMVVFARRSDVMELMQAYRSTALWAEGSSFKFYHRLFSLHYPTLWPLLPIAAVVAIGRNKRYGLFSAIIFGVALLAHSFAAARAERYLYYAVPFFFTLWGLTLAQALPWFRRAVASLVESLLGKSEPTRATRLLGEMIMIVSLLFAIFANPGYLIAVKMTSGRSLTDGAGRPAYWSVDKADWERAVPVLKPWVEDSEVVVTTDGMIALYFLGRYDVEVKGTHIRETETETEWGRDPRSGKRVVASPEAVELLLNCFRSGLFVTDLHDLGDPVTGIGDEAFGRIVARAREISLPEDSYLRALAWTNSSPVSSWECREVRETVDWKELPE